MAIDLTPEQKATGDANFQEATRALGLNRRDFLKAGIVGAGALGGSAAAVYFGYQSLHGNPVKAALIGAGDEGGVLVGEHNPEFLKFVAVCDIRPYNLRRIYDGDKGRGDGLRKGFKRIYGLGCQREGSPDYIAPYDDYQKFYDMLVERKDIEAVVIALPLHLHAKAAIDAMRAGERRGKPIHVLCEKLMAWNIHQCKQMIKVAKSTGSILSIGHQRHYSLLYTHAQEVIRSGILGEIRHIRALWHRNFTWDYEHNRNEFTWAFDDPAMADQQPRIETPKIRDGWFPPVLRGDYEGLEEQARKANKTLDALMQEHGYDSVAQLIRWRLHAETGGGLMAELGSHQLDAASIFLGKVKPLAVHGTGGKFFFGQGKNDRNIDDHVFVSYEFPGTRYNARTNADDRVVVTYSSISTNGFEPYGECLMGSRGTMIVEAEQKVYLYTERNPRAPAGGAQSITAAVQALKKNDAAADSSSTWGPGGPAASVTASAPAAAGAPVSRGYREEMEDFAYCVRLWDAKRGYEKDRDGKYVQRMPRCHGEVAMADAVIALTANKAMATRQRIEFNPEWFDASKQAVPDTEARPKVPVEGVEIG